MTEQTKPKVTLKSFPPTFWLAILFEFFERGSYYGMMSILAVYMTDTLTFTKGQVGLITGTVVPFLIYGLPLISGAVADKLGYRKTLMFAFSMLGIGYIMMSQMDAYGAVFISMVILGIGAGTFKPVISGTIAKVTDKNTSTLGFGIFYWAINLGAFLFPLIIVPILKSIDPSYVFLASAIGTGGMLIPTLIFMKEPTKIVGAAVQTIRQTLSEIAKKIWMVILDWKFILFIFIYSWFWILYFQMFGTVLWYVNDFVDAGSLNHFINNIFGSNWLQNSFGFSWKFDVEHVTVINAGTIILLQLVVSNIVKRTKALPTMLTGIAMATSGMALLALSSNIWIFGMGIIIFSIGEMTAHPKFISYLGLIAPPDKKATYMGFGFLYGVFGSFIGNILGPFLYTKFIDKPVLQYVGDHLASISSTLTVTKETSVKQALVIADQVGLSRISVQAQAQTAELWLIFSGIGVLCIIGLLLYQKFIGTREAQS